MVQKPSIVACVASRVRNQHPHGRLVQWRTRGRVVLDVGVERARDSSRGVLLREDLHATRQIHPHKTKNPVNHKQNR
jgi:hypothetical protein